ncbi:MAG: DUF58 domain-containing protein [Flavobacteriaceae bacterium]|jgi:uncharacterized protein (DUF58 family)|nr:DUF58 domain-containing protein [Flavobacteriaceae bacterium]
MQTSDILKKVRKIEIKTRRLSDHIFSGEYHSHFKGRGMTFSEVRPYQYGDDVRSIDWNVTARYNEPFVKVFEEERELTMLLMVDVSGSEFFGTKTQFKKDTLTEIAATLAFSAIQNNDKVGLLLFSNEIELYIPPKKGRSHVLRIIRELLEFQPKHHQTDLKKALEFLSDVMKKKAIVFMLSDFMDQGYEKPLKIVAKKHDVTAIRVFDPKEVEIPDLGLIPVWDMETGLTHTVDTSSARVRLAYKAHYLRQIDYFKTQFTRSGAGIIHNRTDEDYVKNLLGYFKRV